MLPDTPGGQAIFWALFAGSYSYSWFQKNSRSRFRSYLMVIAACITASLFKALTSLHDGRWLQVVQPLPCSSGHWLLCACIML